MKVRQRISPKLIFDLRPFTFSIAETLHYNLITINKRLDLILTDISSQVTNLSTSSLFVCAILGKS